MKLPNSVIETDKEGKEQGITQLYTHNMLISYNTIPYTTFSLIIADSEPYDNITNLTKQIKTKFY